MSDYFSPESTPVPDPDERAPRSRRRRRIVAGVAASAVIVTGSAVGLGFRGEGSASASAAAATAAAAPQVIVGVPRGYGYGYVSGGYGGMPGQGYGGYPGGFGGSYVGGGAGSAQSAPSTQTTDTTKATADQLTGLVRIVSKTEDGTSIGTGMILSSTGEVVTNHHVVEGATTTKVTVMSTGTTYAADLVGTKASADVAVLQLRGASGLSTVTLDDDALAPSDAVTAIGDAEGLSSLSSATGTVLKLRTPVTTQAEGEVAGETLKNMIEIAADVISGDSGGATVDAEGEVVGMTTAASSGGETVTGYAIPIARVVRIVDRIETGVPSATVQIGYDPFLGVGLASGTTKATIAGVIADSPAAGTDLAAGDTITAIGGTSVTTAAQLRRAIATHAVGDAVRVTWTDAAGSSHGATVTLGKAPIA